MAKKSSAGKVMQPQSVSMSMGNGMNDKNVSVRKINNGYILRESGYQGKGKNQKYFEKETFSSTNPVSVSVKPAVKFGK